MPRHAFLHPLLLAVTASVAAACSVAPRDIPVATPDRPFLVVLGIAQDGGYPHAGCGNDCCRAVWSGGREGVGVASLGLVDPATTRRWMFDATPGFPDQLRRLDETAPPDRPGRLDGVFLTHGHIGHYTGLAHLGREVMGAKKAPVYGMPRMRSFLSSNGPWDQLVRLENIVLRHLANGEPVDLGDDLRVTPFLVPHRDEYTETVGFLIEGPERTAAFIPDIDKWERWDRSIESLIAEVDVALIDGTFFAQDEVPGRNMGEIPHPFIVETIERLAPLPAKERAKVRFIHLNHTNPALEDGSDARRQIEAAGFAVAREGEMIPL